jgi:SAM-dependent methyltransferase
VSGSTWHYGLVARWWAEFSEPGPEIDYFRRLVEQGEPALDVACGTGRLLLPYLGAGLDVDGCDISADMLAYCRDAAEREGLSPSLYAQAMHELDLPRRYRTVFVCGGFGLGSSRDQDLEALRRLYAHLEPGGLLAFDVEAREPAPSELLRPWGEPPHSRRLGSDGAEYALQGRTVAFDPLAQRVTRELRAFMWREGELVAQEEHRLTETFYFENELVPMLERAGFVDVEVRGQHNDLPPTPQDDFLVYLARRPPTEAV